MAEGITPRHSRDCRIEKTYKELRTGGVASAEARRRASAKRCSCQPSFEAWVYLKREDKKLRKTFPTLAAAKSWRADAAAAANKGALRTPTIVTVSAAAEQLLAGMRDGSIPTRAGSRYKPAAIRGYERALRLRILPTLGDVRLSDVRRADVQDLADRLTAQGLAASTVQNTLDPLRVIYRRALRRDLVAADPTKGLELRAPDGRRDRIATPEEAGVLLAALTEADRALWATALFGGLRRGELRALRWSDVDLDARVIRVRRGWDDDEGEQDGKSRAARRTVPIIARLVPLLASHKLATGRDGSALVFGSDAEQPFTPSNVRRRALTAWGWREVPAKDRDDDAPTLERTRDDALDPIGLHEARHTFASLMIAAGVNAKALQTIMGHAAISITFDTYGHLMPGGEDEARERLDGYLQRLDGGSHLRAVGE